MVLKVDLGVEDYGIRCHWFTIKRLGRRRKGAVVRIVSGFVLRMMGGGVCKGLRWRVLRTS